MLRQQARKLGPVARAQIHHAVRNSKHVSYELALAIASRETNMVNKVGDGGHGRGIFQLDDRYQRAFLESHRGCRSGTNLAIYKSAFPAGRVPGIYAGAVRMCQIMDSNVAQAIRDNVPSGKRLRLAISAYNAGYQGALIGFQNSGDSDKNTTGHNYAKDVLGRMAG